MEPLRLSNDAPSVPQLHELAFELGQQAAAFRSSLPESIVSALADLVRAMNCYYSNLIEGHDTHPIDIERAMRKEYSADPAKRNLQLEAAAHIEVQEWIDSGGLEGRAVTVSGIREIHRRFCELLPEELLMVDDPLTGQRIKVEPGEFRVKDIRVGEHIAISPGAVGRFMERYEQAFSRMTKLDVVVQAASVHHRLLWIHPFLDGNGRVARLLSYAQLTESLNTGGIWSIARGLARNVQSYKGHLALCDQARWNDFDGRGNLSERALTDFTRFFLETCLDQVSFMQGLVQPSRLRERILNWASDEVQANGLPVGSLKLLNVLLYRGEVPRNEIANILDASPRTSRRTVSDMIKRGVLYSANDRAPIKLAFPAVLAERWMPGLFPEVTRQ